VILDKFSLKGKVAIVTGSGRGIGKGIALAFADAGADMVCVSRTTSQIEATVAEVRAMGRKALAITCDVRDGEQVQKMVDRTRQEFGKIDILVNNAGGGFYKPAMQMSERAWETTIRGNLTATFIVSQAVARVMLEQKSGAIVNISSRQSQLPSVGQIAYGAAKAGINSLTLTLAWELAPYVRVNCILPGLVWVEHSPAILGPVKDKIIDGTPMKRVGTPEDIALAALYLSSSASDWVTGKSFEIDGGIEFVHLATREMMGQG